MSVYSGEGRVITEEPGEFSTWQRFMDFSFEGVKLKDVLTDFMSLKYVILFDIFTFYNSIGSGLLIIKVEVSQGSTQLQLLKHSGRFTNK